jgi:hypothetical protein
MMGVEGYVMATKRRRSFDTKSFLARVGSGRSIGKYPKGQVVFSQGDAGDAVFYIQKGKAKLTVVSEQGKEAVIAILGMDEFFGEGCLAGQAQRIATVTTMTDSVIARLEKSAIIKVYCASSGPEHPGRSRPCRSAVQFEREAACPPAAAVGELRQGRATRAGDRKNRPGDACGDDRNDPLAREFLHEQISKTGLHRLQRRHRSPQFTVERRSARPAANQELNLHCLRAAGRCDPSAYGCEQFCTAFVAA